MGRLRRRRSVPVGRADDHRLHRPLPVSTHDRHTCALKSDGSLWCWGENGFGQLGTGDLDLRQVPTRVGTSAAWSAIALGANRTCALEQNGSLWCWGENDRGQLGLGHQTDEPVPSRVGTATDWASVSAGTSATCARKVDDSLWCWGENRYGQFGDGTGWSASPSPVL